MERVYSQTGYQSQSQVQAVVAPFMRSVYNWMAAGLVLSGLVAWWVTTSEFAINLLFTYNPTTGAIAPSMWFWGAAIAEIGLVFGLSAGIQRMQYSTALTVFMVYAGLNGVTLAPILLAYTGASVMKVFFITAGTFAVTSIWASTTKKDLSGAGSFLFMGLIGLIIASLVNLFFQSPMVDWVISIVGVGLFVGLTAFDTQQLRAMVLQSANEVTTKKMAIFGALKLYLDFINLFVMLMRLLGDRR